MIMQLVSLGKGKAFQRIFQVLGHIAKGESKTTGRNAPGKDIADGFRFTIKYDDVQHTVKKEFGIKNLDKEYINSIPISLPFEDVYDNIWVGRRHVIDTKGSIGHDCQDIPKYIRVNYPKTQQHKHVKLYETSFGTNGKRTTHVLYDADMPISEWTFCDGTQCTPIMLFRFFILKGDLQNRGVFGISTSSVYDSGRIPMQLLYYDHCLRNYGFTHGIQFVPLVLEKVEEHVTVSTPKTGTFRSDKWLLSVRIAPSFLEKYPIFLTPPKIQQPISNINLELSEDITLEIKNMLIHQDVPVKVKEYIQGVLDCGVYMADGTAHKISETWIRTRLLPRAQKALEKAIHEKNPIKVQAQESSQTLIDTEENTEQPQEVVAELTNTFEGSVEESDVVDEKVTKTT